MKKAIMLALAIGALVAVPAAAMAEWTDGTVKVPTNRTIQFKGNAKFSSGFLGSIVCNTTSQTKLEPGSTGTVESFHPDTTTKTVTEQCTAGGALAGCQVHTVQSTGLPWTAHANTAAGTITITSGEIHTSLTGSFCASKTSTVTAGTVTLTLDNAHAGTNGTLSGQLQVHTEPATAATTISGQQTVQGTDAGTYGVT